MRRPGADGLGLACLEAGAGGRPLLLVHGFCGAKEDFADHLDPLADRGWHVVAPDLRGHGDSDKPDDEVDYAVECFVEDLVGLVDDLGWRRFVVLGHSFGSFVAQRLALDHPARVAAVVLMSTATGAPVGLDPATALRGIDVVRTSGLETLARLQAESGSALDTPAHRRLLAERPGYREWNDAKLLGSSPAMWCAVVDAIVHRPDHTEELGRLDVPTLVVVGEQDEPFVSPSREVAATIPGARLAVVADAGHSPQLEAPAAWWEPVAAFLDEHAARSSTAAAKEEPA